MISATKLSMRYGGKILFKNASLQLNPGVHYGLVGANGAGKSTLIKILAGDLQPESGDISIPSQQTVGILKQNHFVYEDTPILDVVLMGNQGLWDALEKKNKLLEHKAFTEQECHQLAQLDQQIALKDGWSAGSRAAKLLEGLGIPEQKHSHPLRILSGGYKLRVLLAQVLFSEPDVLLLDEPTNHLDLFSIRWLEDYLKNFPGIILLSSHDRAFLNGVCNSIVDIDHETIKTYKGNYETFLTTKTFDRQQKETMLEKQEKKREHLQEFIDRFRAKASKARQAQSKMRFAEQLEEEMGTLDLSPSSRHYPTFCFDQCRPAGAVVLKAQHIEKKYGEKQVLSKVSFEINRGDRVAFLGANGIGKSTLLEILTGHIEANAGEHKWGHATHVAYFPQDHSKHVNGTGTILEWLGRFDALAGEERLRDLLGLVLFTGDDVHKPVSVLSGGETARLLLAKMMLIKHNVLVFDEPTNHLDMEATETLLEALQNYEGTLLFVSHNRHFIMPLATRVIEITTTGVLDYPCTFPEYLEKRELDLLAPQAHRKTVSTEKQTSKNQYEQQKQQQRLKSQQEKRILQAENKCHELEEKIKKIDLLLASDGFYQSTAKAEIDKTLAQKQELERQLDDALTAWENAQI